MRVLIIDDSVDLADALAILVLSHGHEVRIAYRGVAGVEAAETYQPHLVFIDIAMPEMDGYQVARQLRSQGCSATLIAFSGYDLEPEDVAEAGFDQFVIKPMLEPALIRLLAEVAART